MSKEIPIFEARALAHLYGYHQVVIIAREVGNPGNEHVTTYGVDEEHCTVAARIGNFLKVKVMNWAEESKGGKR